MPTPPPDPQQDSVVFQQFEGLRNTISRDGLKSTELATAQNIDLDDVGQVHRRRGYTQVATGNFHSLFTDENGVAYGVKDGALGIINSDYSFNILRGGISADPLAYVQVGETVYFSSVTNSGKIHSVEHALTKFAEDGSNGGHQCGLSSTVSTITSGTIVRVSVQAKPLERSAVMLFVFDGVADPFCGFDLANGVMSTPVSCTPQITPLADGWYEVSITFPMAATSVASFYFFLARQFAYSPAGIFGASFYTGTSGKGLLFRQAQWTENAGPPNSIDLTTSVAGGFFSTFVEVVAPWGAENDTGFWLSPVVNPTDTLPPIAGRTYAKPPMATALTYFNGRIYLASEHTVWATELYLYDYIDKTKNFFNFESPVTALGTVTDGIYVGTETGLWFLSGSFPLKRIRIMGAGVLPGSMVDIPTELVHPQGQANLDTPLDSKNAVIFTTTVG